MLGSNRSESFDPLFSKAGAESMLRLCERFQHYGMYGEKSIDRLVARTNYYPTGAKGPPIALSGHHTTAILLDTDSIFHGVDRVTETRAPLPELRPGMQLAYRGDRNWQVGLGEKVLDRYTWDDLRFSISWKAYCYADDADRRRAHEHTEDLNRRTVLDTLSADLRERGRIGDELPDDTGLALIIIDEYIHYPTANPASPAS